MTKVGSDLEVTVHPELCMGIGDCRRLMPNVFVPGQEARSTVREDADVDVDVDQIVDVAYTCPNGAISVERSGQSLL